MVNTTIEYFVHNTNDVPTPSGSAGLKNSLKSSKVKFGSIDIYTHDIILGDNPSVSRGPPLALNWQPINFERFTLEEFEERFGPGGLAKKVSFRSREEWLREIGHRSESLRRVCEEIEYIKYCRLQSQTEIHFTPVQEYLAMARATSKRHQRKLEQIAIAPQQPPFSKKPKSMGFTRLPRFIKKLAA